MPIKEITGNECVNERHPFVKSDDKYCVITGKRYEIGCRPTLIVLFTLKSHTSFRLVSKLVTLNDIERLNDHRRALSRR